MADSIFLRRQLHIIAKLAGKNIIEPLGHVESFSAKRELGDLFPKRSVEIVFIVISPSDIHKFIAGVWHQLFNLKHLVREIWTGSAK